MLSKEEIIATKEWQALNRIWKTMTAAQRSAVQEEFRCLTDFVKENVGRDPATAYLEDLSPEARKFLQDLVKAGEPNLYHSLISVIGGSLFEKQEDVLAYYLLKFGKSRPYLAENLPLVEEILALCWKQQLERGFRPGEGF
ncbi:MAG: hypothetical protein LUE61_05485 [Clostridiales bacterium]|nr:hypothetical protein [Clostridiales bacterium]